MAAAEAARLTLVSGPASSGKSRWAEHCAKTSGLRVVYLATGPQLPDDPSWQERLARHRQRRSASWGLQEVGGELTAALERLLPGELGLVDSLGTWVAAHLEDDPQAWKHRTETLLEGCDACQAALVVVCEEVSWGVVPATVAGGRFRERLGELQQRFASRCDAAWLVVQGRAIDLLCLGVPVPPEGDGFGTAGRAGARTG